MEDDKLSRSGFQPTATIGVTVLDLPPASLPMATVHPFPFPSFKSWMNKSFWLWRKPANLPSDVAVVDVPLMFKVDTVLIPLYLMALPLWQERL